ncbi:hypothetical protein MMC30_009178 [Trapelia coarctata]|nr:hypothetical protein [Trapelia coarctata]
MDAPEEKDVALQQASSDLLLRLKTSLPRFLWSSKAPSSPQPEKQNHVRVRVRTQTTDELVHLLEPFQEWPQLLDPDLNQLLVPLVDAFLVTLWWTPEKHHTSSRHAGPQYPTMPLPRAACKLLYSFCKIRGPKVITRFFNNEPMYLEHMLDAFESRNGLHHLERTKDGQDIRGHTGLVWQETYIMLLWLSHLLLMPFDLASIGSLKPCESENLLSLQDVPLPSGLPPLAARLMSVGIEYLVSAGKEREAAVLLLTRLVLRPDMNTCGLLHTLIAWAIKSLQESSQHDAAESIYTHIGILSFLASTINLADAVTLVPFLIPIFNCIQSVNAAETQLSRNILSSAIARKIIIKILRSVTVISLKLDSNSSSNTYSIADHVLEEVIQHALSSLADKDTPVRFAGSKALSLVTSSLHSDKNSSMADEVVEAVIGTLEEKVLWVPVDSPGIRNVPPGQGNDRGPKKRDLSAVNPLQWQGLVLTLSHMLFRGSPSRDQLPKVLAALTTAIGFEQRSTSGVSSGTSVRDAACFGIWSLARRYSTAELMAVDISTLSTGSHGATSVLQIIADELVVTASTDPSGNIRRGASAALQELIGRHPDTVIEGISLVQIVDYHAVALRSRALKEVAVHAAELDSHYWSVVLDGLLSWRAIDAPDIDSRRHAGHAIGILSTMRGLGGLNLTVESIMNDLEYRKNRQVEKRHGLLLAAAAVVTQVDTAGDERMQVKSSSSPRGFWEIFKSRTFLEDKDFTSSVLRPGLTAEGACTLMSALASSCRRAGSFQPTRDVLEECWHIVDLSLANRDENVLGRASDASGALFNLLDNSWRHKIVSQWVSQLLLESSTTRQSARGVLGYLAALGAVFKSCSSESTLQRNIVEAILGFVNGETEIEAKVGALRCLSAGVLPSHAFTAEISDATAKSLQDYTTDQRGDVGSLVRIEGIAVVHAAWKHGLLNESAEHRNVIGLVCGLAVEKLDKVRHRAWLCLQDIWYIIFGTKAAARYRDLHETSSTEYYSQVMSLLSVPWIRRPFIQGLLTTAGGGSESLLCTTRATLLDYLERGHEQLLILLWEDLLSALQPDGQKERLTIPVLEVLSFLLENSVWDRFQATALNWRKMFSLVQKAHYKSGNVHKLSATIDVYVGLCSIKSIRSEVQLKLAGMLLHPFPNIRNKAADALYMLTLRPGLEVIDWSRSPIQLKSSVLRIQSQLKSVS